MRRDGGQPPKPPDGRAVADWSSPAERSPPRRSPLPFFVLVFALSVRFWLLGAATRRQLSPDLPVSSFILVCPAIAALILVDQEDGSAGVTTLLKRSFDYGRTRAKLWSVPTVLLLPGVQALTYGLMRVTGLPLPTVPFPVLTALVALPAFFIGALGEELG